MMKQLPRLSLKVVLLSIPILLFASILIGQSYRPSLISERIGEKKHRQYQSRYFLTESALSPANGQISLQNKFIVLNSIEATFAKYATVELGASYNGEGFSPFISGKIGVPLSDQLHIGAKYFTFFFKGKHENLLDSYYSVYATIGNPKNHVTLGYMSVEEENYRILSEYIKKAGTIAGSFEISKYFNGRFEQIYDFKYGFITVAGLGANLKWGYIDFGFIRIATIEDFDYTFPFLYGSIMVPIN